MLNETITFEKMMIFCCSFGGMILIIDPSIFFSDSEGNESQLSGFDFFWLALVFFAAALKAFLNIVLKKGVLKSWSFGCECRQFVLQCEHIGLFRIEFSIWEWNYGI